MSSKPVGPIRRAWYRWKALRLPWRKRFLVGLDLQGNTFWEFHDALAPPNTTRMRRIVTYPRATHLSDVTSKISPAWHQWLRHTRADPPSLTEQSQDLVRQQHLKVLAAQADARWEAKGRLSDIPQRQKAGAPFRIGGDTSREVEELRLRAREGQQKIKELDAAPQPPSSPAMLDKQQQEGQSASRTEAGAMSKDLEEQIKQTNTQPKIDMQHPDGKRHPFLHKPASQMEDSRRGKEPKIYKEDPWKKAQKGPSEDWQPEAWNPGAATARR